MEAFFVDVGQGTCQVLLLGSRRAVVIDCGERDPTLVHLLRKDLKVERIACLIISHNHDDHVGGAATLLSDYEGQIDRICVVHDHKLRDCIFWRRIMEQRKKGILQDRQLFRLERDNSPRLLLHEPALALKLWLLSPLFTENLDAHFKEQPNATSAVVLLTVGAQVLVFPGDSTIAQWKRIREERGTPLDCQVMAVPHHGGTVAASVAELDWLYSDAVRPKLAVVSAGTSNNDGHPREEVIRSLRNSGAVIICTQITGQCCNDLERLRPALLRPPKYVGRARPTLDRTKSGNSRNVACAGTVRVDVDSDKVQIERLGEHQAAVDRLARSGNHPMPLCRR